jgi:hypothetical protein
VSVIVEPKKCCFLPKQGNPFPGLISDTLCMF